MHDWFEKYEKAKIFFLLFQNIFDLKIGLDRHENITLQRQISDFQ